VRTNRSGTRSIEDLWQYMYYSQGEGSEGLMGESAISDLEMLLFQLIDFQPDATFAIDIEGRVIAWNRAMEDLTGLDKSEILGKAGYEYAVPFYGAPQPLLIDYVLSRNEEILTLYTSIKADGEAISAEAEVMLWQDEQMVLWSKAQPLYDFRGNIIGAIESLKNITAYKKIQNEFKDVEARYRALFDRSLYYVYVHDINGKYIDANKAALDATGYTLEEFTKLKLSSLIVKEQIPLLTKMWEEILKHGHQISVSELTIKKKDGTTFTIESNGALIYRDGKPYAIQGVARDITEQINIQKALKESTEKYRNIIENIQEGYFEVDLSGSFTLFNHVICDTLGYSEQELMGMSYRDYMDEENARKVYEQFHQVFLTDKSIKAFEWEQIRKNGSSMYVEASIMLIRNARGEPVGFQGIVRDITERKEAENERARQEMRLLQAQKMEAIGTLASGIAHDFNNMLSGILGYGELIKQELPEGSRGLAYCDQITRAGKRARELVQQILSFSREYKAQRELIQVRLIMEEALKLLRATIPTNIEIQSSLDKASSMVNCDPTEIHQIVMNLCTNAYQAMETTGGTMRVGLSTSTLDEHFTADYPNLQPGTYVVFSVSDTGCGMDMETRKHIFDPFFTTKEKGKGTGFGLATVQRIVNALKGEITIDTSLNKGSTFTIYLPCHKPE
jgi:two-component system cell cycle sensor histidine kinase/response regulator CckA